MGGIAGMLLGGALMGAGAAGMSKPKINLDTSTLQSALPTVPEAPKPPEPDANGSKNSGMEAEREKERQAALLRQRNAPEIFTSGLGAAGLAATAKKVLLGG